MNAISSYIPFLSSPHFRPVTPVDNHEVDRLGGAPPVEGRLSPPLSLTGGQSEFNLETSYEHHRQQVVL